MRKTREPAVAAGEAPNAMAGDGGPRPRAAIVTHTLAIGGSPRSLLNVAAAVRQHGFEPVLFYGKEGPLEAEFAGAAIPCRHLAKKRGLLGLHMGFIYRILTQYRRDKVRFVFLNCLVSYYKYHALAARLLGLPVIWSIREDVRSKRARRLLKWLQRLADMAMPCSAEIAEALRERGVSVSMRVVHNGITETPVDAGGIQTGGKHAGDLHVDGPMGLRRCLKIPADHWVVGCVGSIEARKGQLDLVAAAATWHSLDGPLDLVIIGAPGTKGPADPYYQALQRAASRLPKHVKVHLYGAHKDVHRLYADMDTVCLPTYWEGSSRTILEAMRARRPLLTTTAGGNPELVRHLESAYLVPPGDCQALAEGLRYLKHHPEAGAAFAQTAYSDLIRDYTLSHYTSRVGAVVEAVMQ
jgi:glycosyltransferase involved in cell wall biosynthesis